MKALTATQVARQFSRVLDSLEQGGEEVVVLRNNQPVARLVPGAARMTVLEALADLEYGAFRASDPGQRHRRLSALAGLSRAR